MAAAAPRSLTAAPPAAAVRPLAAIRLPPAVARLPAPGHAHRQQGPAGSALSGSQRTACPPHVPSAWGTAAETCQSVDGSVSERNRIEMPTMLLGACKHTGSKYRRPIIGSKHIKQQARVAKRHHSSHLAGCKRAAALEQAVGRHPARQLSAAQLLLPPRLGFSTRRSWYSRLAASAAAAATAAKSPLLAEKAPLRVCRQVQGSDEHKMCHRAVGHGVHFASRQRVPTHILHTSQMVGHVHCKAAGCNGFQRYCH